MLAPGGNPLSELFIPKDAALDEYEICPEAGVIVEHMSNIIEKNGGSSLIIDYGKDGPSGVSLRVSMPVVLSVIHLATGIFQKELLSSSVIFIRKDIANHI